MKNRCIKAFSAVALAAALSVSLSATAFASNNPYAAVEAKNRQAVEAAVAAGSVPAGTGVFDCMYQTGDDGVMRVVQYRDANGVWIDVASGQAKAYLPGTFTEKLADETLADYAAEVFRLVNEAREDAGLAPLERDEELDAAAMLRAEELKQSYSHTRPDGSRFFTVFGVEENYCYGENIGGSGGGPEDQMEGWMQSEGHRENILDQKWGYTKIGVGVYQDENGALHWCQLFYRPI